MITCTLLILPGLWNPSILVASLEFEKHPALVEELVSQLETFLDHEKDIGGSKHFRRVGNNFRKLCLRGVEVKYTAHSNSAF